MTQINEDDFENTTRTGHRWKREIIPASELAHYLVVNKEGETTMARIELGDEPITIGRDARQSLVLVDTKVSRVHARVSLIKGDVVVEDLGSTNGTFLNGQRISKPVKLKDGRTLGIGNHLVTYQRRSRREFERALELDRDLQKASEYLASLLPAPLTAGPVRTDWRFVPSTQLGGDAFGYQWLDPNTFAFYLIDISGHGAGAAMHSVAVLNVLRQHALPQVDFANPAEILASLNNRFQMDSHSGMFFTMWYGVYDTETRRLTFGSAGHHQAYLIPADKSTLEPLGTPSLMIGAVPDLEYRTQEAQVTPGSALYLFSDGIFEVTTADQKRWTLPDFEPLLLEPTVADTPESSRLYQAVRRVTGPGPLDDDASLLVLTFP